LLGNVAAVVFSSVGPCFYDAFYGVPRYVELMNYLHRESNNLPIWALRAQEYLLMGRDGVRLGAGISAFPSLHVAAAMLNVMLSWRLSRPWRITSVVFLLLILVGSVHLGWHYAVDGLAAIIAVPVIWWVAGKFSLAPLAERWLLARGTGQVNSAPVLQETEI
jgi:membrane-associated phospholipid phosphatase